MSVCRFLERSIWRRLYNYDDWSTIAATMGKSDDEISEQNRQTALYATLYLCNEAQLLADDSPLRLQMPTEVAFEEQAEGVLEILYPTLSNLERSCLKTELVQENQLLQRNVQSFDFDAWVESVAALVRQDINFAFDISELNASSAEAVTDIMDTL